MKFPLHGFIMSILLPTVLTATTQYVDREAWETAVGTVSTIDFNSFRGESAPEGLDVQGFHFDGESVFSSSPGGWGPIPPCFNPYTGQNCSFTVRQEGVDVTPSDDPYLAVRGELGTETLEIEFPTGIYSFGFNYLADSGYHWQYVEDIARPWGYAAVFIGDRYAANYMSLAAGFNGFISDTPVERISFEVNPILMSISNSYRPTFQIDDFSFNSIAQAPTSSAVPEPGTALIAGAGVIILLLKRRTNQGIRSR